MRNIRPRPIHAGRISATLLLSAATLLFSPAPARADNASLCHRDIAKSVAKLRQAYHKNLGQCLKFGNYDACFSSTASTVQSAKNRLHARITSEGSACDLAVNVDGHPVSDFGPATCPPAWGRCDQQVPSIPGLWELSGCLQCVEAGYDVALRTLVDIPEFIPEGSERLCMRRLHGSLAKAIRAGARAVDNCAADTGAKPFACTADDTPPAKFGVALAKLADDAAGCSDDLSADGEILRTLCLRNVQNTSDLAQCMDETARCLVCQLENSTYGQSHDCQSAAGVWACTGTSAPDAGAFYVVDDENDTIALYEYSEESYGEVASKPVGSAPSAVATNRSANLVYVANRDDGTVTYLDALTGDYANGSLFNSSFVVGTDPVALAVEEEYGILYVVNEGSGSVTMLDALDGSYPLGTLAASSFAVGNMPSAAAINESFLYVTNYADDTVTYIDAIDGTYAFATLGASSFPTGDGPSDVETDVFSGQTGANIAITNALDGTYIRLGAATGSPVFGPLATTSIALDGVPAGVARREHFERPWTFVSDGSGTVTDVTYFSEQRQSIAAAGTGPLHIAANRETGHVYVTDASSDTVTVYLPGNDRQLSSSPTYGGDELAIDKSLNRIYVANDGNSVTFFDATTLSPANGTLENSTFPGGSGDTDGIAVDTTNHVVFVTNYHQDSVTMLDGVTGAYENGSFAASTFAVGLHPREIVVSTALDRAFVVNYGNGGDGSSLTILVASTGAYANGTLVASTVAPAGGVGSIAVNESEGLAYVGSGYFSSDPGRVVYLDALTGAYASGSEAASTVTLGLGVGGLAVNEADGILYAIENGPDNVVFLDAATGAFEYGTEAASSFAVPNGSNDVTYSPVTGMAYVGTAYGSFGYMDGVSGQFLFGAFGNSSIDISAYTFDLVADPLLPRIYGVFAPFGVSLRVMDGTINSYLNPNIPIIASAPTGPSPSAIATME